MQQEVLKKLEAKRQQAREGGVNVPEDVAEEAVTKSTQPA